MDRETFEREISEHMGDLYRTGFWLSRSQEVAEDLVQEAALKAFRKRSTFETGGNFKAWMSKIITNAYIDRYRRKQKQEVTTDFEKEPAYVELEAPPYFAVDEMDRWEDLVDETVQRAIAGLPDVFRIPFLLFGLCGLKYEEIARLLEIPVGTVMSRLYRARTTLKKELREYVSAQLRAPDPALGEASRRAGAEDGA